MLPRMQTSAAHADYAARIAFVAELAERLHTYGTTVVGATGASISEPRFYGVELQYQF